MIKTKVLALHLAASLALLLATATAWLRADSVEDDRGSDSSEKALMVILAISIGTLVTGAATVYITTKTGLFK